MSTGDEVRRRDVLTGGLALGTAATTGLSFWSRLATAQDEVLVPFSDVPEGFVAPPATPGAIHFLDTRLIDTFYTSPDDFYIVQHYNQPVIDPSTYRLRVTGLVDRPLDISYEELRGMNRFEIDAGFECGGNNANLFQGLIGNARWTGVRLKDLLNRARVQDAGIEVVFYGTDMGTENVRDTDVEVSFGRSMDIDDAMATDAIIAYEMNGVPLPLYHGAPVRLVVPGWYGVANVKWLSQIHLQDRRYMGRFMARDYVTLSRRDIGGVERWEERSVTRMRLKSSIIRVTRQNDTHTVTGFVLNDGTPIRSVEVSIDGGPWQRATIDPDATKYSWKIFRYRWDGATPGEHTLVSRVTDVNGQVQATPDEMPPKPSRWENYAQFPRKIVIG